MSNTKTVMSQAANTQGLPLDITDVFSTYLYEGTSAAQTITNGIDLAGEGGLVWLKGRGASNHHLIDTERGSDKYLLSNVTNAEQTSPAGSDVTSFNSDGFSFGTYYSNINFNGYDYASWTFRKAPKFFDVVTYTGTGSAQSIAHNLGGTVGSIIIKRTNTTSNWAVYHRANTVAPETDYLSLNLTNATADDATFWNDTAPTSTQFTVGTNAVVNASGGTYVAYLFAHNDGDGEFGPSGDQDIIKCGSFTTDTGANASVELGFEPQFLLIKRTDSTDNWKMFDVMRGMSNWDYKLLYPNLNIAEGSGTGGQFITPEATGFKTDVAGAVTASATYIYMAIRRGPLAPPESGTEVFAVKRHAGADGPQPAGITSDMLITTNSEVANTERFNFNRLTNGKVLYTSQTFAEGNYSAYLNFGTNNGVNTTGFWGNTSVPLYYHWKRAPSFFDVVAYTGAGAGTTFNHNLGVAPEMIWVKNRSRSNTNWNAYHKDLKLNGVPDTAMDCTLFPNINSGISGIVDFWGSSGPSDTQVILGTNSLQNSWSGDTFISYLFATLAGVSKVFSVTKSSGSDASVDCGFTSGPRFVMLKRTDSTGDWYVWDTERGIVAGNDPYLLLNSTAAEVTSTDYIDPTSNGFTIVNGGLADGDYIGYAVA